MFMAGPRVTFPRLPVFEQLIKIWRVRNSMAESRWDLYLTKEACWRWGYPFSTRVVLASGAP